MTLPKTMFSNKRKLRKMLICFLVDHAYLPDKQPFRDSKGVGRYTICHRCGLYQLTEYRYAEENDDKYNNKKDKQV